MAAIRRTAVMSLTISSESLSEITKWGAMSSIAQQHCLVYIREGEVEGFPVQCIRVFSSTSGSNLRFCKNFEKAICIILYLNLDIYLSRSSDNPAKYTSCQHMLFINTLSSKSKQKVRTKQGTYAIFVKKHFNCCDRLIDSW